MQGVRSVENTADAPGVTTVLLHLLGLTPSQTHDTPQTVVSPSLLTLAHSQTPAQSFIL